MLATDLSFILWFTGIYVAINCILNLLSESLDYESSSMACCCSAIILFAYMWNLFNSWRRCACFTQCAILLYLFMQNSFFL